MSRRSRPPKQIDATRRQVLSMMGACGASPFLWDPVSALIGGLVDGLIQKAQAEANPTSVQPRKFVYINLSGGPVRWYWDLPLRPYASSPAIMRNPFVATRFTGTGGNAGALDYVTTTVTRNGVTLNMPHLWSATIPTASGTWVPMSQLLDNMLMIRGVSMGADGHPDNNRKQLRPLMAEPSVHGRIADVSETPLPVVHLDGSTASNSFKSAKGYGVTKVDNASNPLSEVLSPFDRSGDALPAAFLTRRAAMEQAMKNALSSLGEYARSAHPGAGDLFTLRGRAEKLIKDGIGGASAAYTPLLNKYKALITACANWSANPITGLTDKPIAATDYTANAKAFAGGTFSGADLRTLIGNTSIASGIAEGFAVAEYLILNGYSSSVVFGTGGVRNIDQVVGGFWGFDEHAQGQIGSVVVNAFFYRMFASCLNEFISALKAGNQFSETVIQVGSEFSRNPRSGLGGSDHGWQANCTSLFSGVIDRPYVLGHQLLDSNPGATDHGTWGAAAKVRVDGSETELGIGHSTSTVAALLRVKPPVVNNGSLVVESGSGITPTIDLATTKDGA